LKLTTAEHDEAFHDGMEAAYGNLAALLDRLHARKLHLVIWMEWRQIIAAIDGEGLTALPAEASGSAITSFSAERVDELLGGVEGWCSEWLPTGHEVADARR